MSPDVTSAEGASATDQLVAGDQPSVPAAGATSRHAPAVGGQIGHPPVKPAVCENCGHSVCDHYCGHCGQRREHSVHSVWHFTQEATEDLTHADSRLWVTLRALMFKPGFLTREFLEGRRVRYLPPLRLYLVLSVVFFLVISLHGDPKVMVLAKHGGSVSMSTAPAEQALGPLKPGETAEQRDARLCNPDYDGPGKSIVVPFARKSCKHLVAGNGVRVAESFIHNIARAMFVFLPVLALLMKLLYRRPPRYFVEHLLFFVHAHAFAFLTLALLELVSSVSPAPVADALGVVVWAYIIYYVYAAMRSVYGQGKLRTFGKLIALALAYLVGFVVMMAATGIYSVLST